MERTSQAFEFSLGFDGRGFERGLGRARDASGRFVSQAVSDAGRVSKAFGSSLGRSVAKSAQPMAKLSSSARSTGTALKGAAVGAKGAAAGIHTLSAAVSTALGPLAAFGAAFAAFDGLRSLASEAAAFETAMAEVATLIPGVPVQQLGEDVRQMAASMGIAGVDAAKALYQAISSGRTPAEALQFLRSSATLAVGGVSSLEETTKLLSGTLNAFGMSGRDAGRAADVLFTAVKNGTTTIPELASSMGKITETAKQAGQSLEQTTGVIAALTGPGTSTAEAVTQLKNLIAGFAKPTNTASAAAAKLGFDLNAAALRSQGFEATMAKLREALARASAEGRDQTTVLNELFPSLEAAQAAAVLTGSGFEKMKKSIDDANNSAGAAAKAAETVQDATGNKLKVILESTKVELMKLGDAFLSGVDAAIEWVGGVDAIREALVLMRIGVVSGIAAVTTWTASMQQAFQKVMDAGKAIGSYFSNLFQGFSEGFGAITKFLSGDFAGARAAFERSVEGFGEAIVGGLADVPIKVGDALVSVVSEAGKAGRDAADAFNRELRDGIGNLGGGSTPVGSGATTPGAPSSSGPAGRILQGDQLRRAYIESENRRLEALERAQQAAYDAQLEAARSAAAARIDGTRTFEAQRLQREAYAAEDRLRVVERQEPRISAALDRAFAGAVSSAGPSLQQGLSKVIASVSFETEQAGRRAFVDAERQLQRSSSFNIFAGRGAAGLTAEDVARFVNPTTFFAAGGGVAERSGISGTGDKVPAMLDPREFVVSPGPAMAFRPQLEALNAGRAAPSVTNVNRSQSRTVNLGGINVAGGGDAKAIAAEVIREIKRSTRLGLM